MRPPGGGQFDYIKSPQAQLRCFGPLSWSTVHVDQNGSISVWNALNLELELVIRHSPIKPFAPTVQLMLDGRDTWRVDHNQEHRHVMSTHLQLGGDRDYCLVLDPVELCSPPISPDVSSSLIARAFRASAKYFNIDIKGLEWSDPPEEA